MLELHFLTFVALIILFDFVQEQVVVIKNLLVVRTQIHSLADALKFLDDLGSRVDVQPLGQP